jgi:putative phosphoesterase
MLLNQKTDFTEQGSLKIAIVSDTHEELAPEIIDIIADCELAMHAGDIGSSSVLESMKTKTGHIIAVAGNNDKPYLWDFKDWNLVKGLPGQLELHMPGGKISIEHGHRHDMYKPAHEDLRAAHKESRLVVYGHTHIQVIDTEEECHVINPGAAGYTRNKGGPSCVILTINQDNWDYDVLKFEDKAVS